MTISKATAIAAAVALLAVGGLIGDVRSSSAGQQDQTAQVVAQLRIANGHLSDQTRALNKIQTEIGDYPVGNTLRHDVENGLYKVCAAIQKLPDNSFYDCAP